MVSFGGADTTSDSLKTGYAVGYMDGLGYAAEVPARNAMTVVVRSLNGMSEQEGEKLLEGMRRGATATAK